MRILVNDRRDAFAAAVRKGLSGSDAEDLNRGRSIYGERQSHRSTNEVEPGKQKQQRPDQANSPHIYSKS